MTEVISYDALQSLTDEELKSQFNSIADRIVHQTNEREKLLNALNTIKAEIYWRKIRR